MKYENIESSLLGIKSILLDSEDFRKLMYNNSASALSEPAPTKEQLEGYVVLKPIANKDTYQSNMLGIYVDIIDETSTLTEIVISLDLIIKEEEYQLDNNRLRIFALMEAIKGAVDYQTFSFGRGIRVLGWSRIPFNSSYIGFSSTLTAFTDGNAESRNTNQV